MALVLLVNLYLDLLEERVVVEVNGIWSGLKACRVASCLELGSAVELPCAPVLMEQLEALRHRPSTTVGCPARSLGQRDEACVIGIRVLVHRPPQAGFVILRCFRTLRLPFATFYLASTRLSSGCRLLS